MDDFDVEEFAKTPGEGGFASSAGADY